MSWLSSPKHESEKWKGSHSVVSDSLRPHRLQPTRLLCPWDFPGKSTEVGCHSLLENSWLELSNKILVTFCFEIVLNFRKGAETLEKLLIILYSDSPINISLHLLYCSVCVCISLCLCLCLSVSVCMYIPVPLGILELEDPGQPRNLFFTNVNRALGDS